VALKHRRLGGAVRRSRAPDLRDPPPPQGWLRRPTGRRPNGPPRFPAGSTSITHADTRLPRPPSAPRAPHGAPADDQPGRALHLARLRFGPAEANGAERGRRVRLPPSRLEGTLTVPACRPGAAWLDEARLVGGDHDLDAVGQARVWEGRAISSAARDSSPVSVPLRLPVGGEIELLSIPLKIKRMILGVEVVLTHRRVVPARHESEILALKRLLWGHSPADWRGRYSARDACARVPDGGDPTP
jgi:hypothetical protein